MVANEYMEKNKTLNKELRIIKRIKKFNRIVGLKKFLQREIEKNKNKIFMYALRKMEKEKQEYRAFKRNILLLKSEIIKKRRDLIYENEFPNVFIKNIGIVKRKDRKEFYPFKGAFWADELGHYHFDLKDKCKK